jgi:hypothetical protein
MTTRRHKQDFHQGDFWPKTDINIGATAVITDWVTCDLLMFQKLNILNECHFESPEGIQCTQYDTNKAIFGK